MQVTVILNVKWVTVCQAVVLNLIAFCAGLILVSDSITFRSDRIFNGLIICVS